MQEPLTKKEISRRDFLRKIVLGTGGIIAVALGVPVIASVLSPALKDLKRSGIPGIGFLLPPSPGEGKETWIPVASANEISPGEPVKVEYILREKDGWVTKESTKAVWALTQDGKSFTVYDPRCTHLGCPYSWSDSRKLFLCPCHDGVFDIDGKVVSGPPPRPLDRYETKVADGTIYIGKLISGGTV